MSAGLRYVQLSPQIRRILARASMFGFAASALPALMPLVARDLLAGGPFTYGALLGGFGIGAVIGALASGGLRRRFSTEVIIRLAGSAVAAGALISGRSETMVLSIPILILAGAGWVLSLSTFNVSVQMASPRWVVARTISLYQMAAFGGIAIGSWVFGAIASSHGAGVALAVAAAMQILGVAAGFVLPLPQISELNLDPHDHWREPNTVVPVESRSGPIVITVEHRIAEADVAAFLGVMSERRRIRRRDGARHWSLQRDLFEPSLWIEMFRFPTWLDYVRHNGRRTNADQANSDALHKLWIDGPAVVHRRIERQTGSLPSGRAPGGRELDPVTDPSRSN